MSEKRRFEELIKSIQGNDPDHLDFLMRSKNPHAVRNELENTLGKFVKDNYDLPDNRLNELFENKFNTPSIKEIDMRDWGEYDYTDKNKPSILIRKGLTEPEKMGTKLHELGHHNDVIRGYDIIDPLKSEKLSSLSGLESAENYFKGHHKKGLFGLESLKELISNGKIKTIAPLIAKTLSTGAIGAAALGIGQKAHAGDLEGAKEEGINLAKDLLVPDFLYSENVNSDEKELLNEIEKANKTPESRRFSKIKNILEN